LGKKALMTKWRPSLTALGSHGPFDGRRSRKSIARNAFSDNFSQLTAPGSDGPSVSAVWRPSKNHSRRTPVIWRPSTTAVKWRPSNGPCEPGLSREVSKHVDETLRANVVRCMQARQMKVYCFKIGVDDTWTPNFRWFRNFSARVLCCSIVKNESMKNRRASSQSSLLRIWQLRWFSRNNNYSPVADVVLYCRGRDYVHCNYRSRVFKKSAVNDV